MQGKEAAECEHTTKFPLVVLVPGSGEDFERDDSSGREWLVRSNGSGEPKVGGASRCSLELDPRRAVYEDHGGET